MNATTTHTANSQTAAVPLLPEARQKAGEEGQTRTVVMNGSKITMQHDGVRWVNVLCYPSNRNH